MEGIRARLTYANVMATLAVFIALGGGAYALSRGEVKSKHIATGAVKARQLNLGNKGVPMMATFTGLDSGTGDENYHPVGTSATGTGLFNESITPQAFVASGLRVRVYNDVATGSRTFVLKYAPLPGPTTTTDLACEVEAGENDCQSNARVRIPEGVDIWFEDQHTGTSNDAYAEVGWRALLP
jgi:hypothetical protein